MLVVSGIYENGEIRLEKKVDLKEKRKVTITFSDEKTSNENKILTKNDFSFERSRKKSSHYDGNLSDEIISERRDYL